MLKRKSIERNYKQLKALIERNLLFETRFKVSFIERFISPLIQMVMIFIIFGVIYTINSSYSFGYWNSSNFLLFLFLGFSLQYLRPIISKYQRMFLNEKYWKTLQSLLIAPLNRLTLMIATALTELIIVSIPLFVILGIAFFLYPIPIYILFLVLLVYFCIVITFGSLGLILGAFVITNENLNSLLVFLISIIFWLSCVTYPLGIFPEIIQIPILFNPLYYYFDLLRIFWLMGVDFELAIGFLSPVHFIVVISITFAMPFISIYIFQKMFNKFGITGY